VARDAHPDPDVELLRQVAGGSADALGRLYDRHAAKVYGLARRMLARLDDAEEVVQDVFAQIWREAPRYRHERASVAGWMIMLTRTRAIDRLRARRARPDLHSPVDPSPGLALTSDEPDPEAIAISARDAEQLRAALQELPAEQRSLLNLAYYEGLSHSEIAEKTGVALGTVKTRIRTAMITLREALA
jgi:RNA polymerase sigma-70 factor (ECF subfamily)